ncbi:RNA-binding transcriptional accessory protein [Domibacillus antri]|uniref:RNA-binding transcriptional accessory protein n=1 Tax=Domibacillus antri TaxID=1714264 RepID=A0A1Q8Q3D4_9BACI|nr:Tex family protein [Domibacillus antri]OLN21812.1 RNA-binding transcriptional accessory protein [Domibacillus antri]
MEDKLLQETASDTGSALKSVKAVIQLTEEGNTIPFIARYRKEMTGSLDEVEIRNILERFTYRKNMEQRKEDVIRSITEQNKMTPELEEQIKAASTLQAVEDLYRPYKQKKRTKASVAKEKGLESFAEWLLQFPQQANVEKEAEKYISDQVLNAEEAVQGASDIIAERIADDASVRQRIRLDMTKYGKIKSELKGEDEKEVYKMYYDYEEAIGKIAPHRTLAVNRGEKEDVLKVSISFDEERVIRFLTKKFITDERSPAAQVILDAARDAYKRLIRPSVEREVRNELTEIAEERAIHIFSENLKNLLLQPPLKGKVVLAVDPAYRTGCKLAVVDETGKVLSINVIYPHVGEGKRKEAQIKFKQIADQYEADIIAIGNGTASRETERFVVEMIPQLKKKTAYIIVNEAGASVYSASDIAREEFPDLQVEERSAVSIARRIQDPLAELVKIDPQSIGVGQYQHDVSQKKLSGSLSFVVETAVNRVGVDVNTASPSLLEHVAGLNKTVARNIVQYREENGKFTKRSVIKKVPRLGGKTFEQCIGFLRITDGEEPLDRTPIHPERYNEVTALLKRLGFTTKDIGSSKLAEALQSVNIQQTAAELEIGDITLLDIIDSLQKPGRDPRDELPAPLLKTDVLKMEDLKKGMELEGTVRNVTDFGAFVDIGVKQDGLVHISKLKKGFVKNPFDVVAVGDIVKVWVESVEADKGRISLAMVKTDGQ